MKHSYVMADVKSSWKFVVCVRVCDGPSTIILWKNIKSTFKWNTLKFCVKNNISDFKSLCTIFQVLGQYLCARTIAYNTHTRMHLWQFQQWIYPFPHLNFFMFVHWNCNFSMFVSKALYGEPTNQRNVLRQPTPE